MIEETQDENAENRYLKRFEQEFKNIVKEIGLLSMVVPEYKNENDSLRERIENIREWAEVASKIRYLPDADTDAVLANLITQILIETDNLDQLKPITKMPDLKSVEGDLFSILATTKNIEMDEAFCGFDFYENNPYKKSAEKKIAKMKKKNAKGRQ
jgi:hypothetical protein